MNRQLFFARPAVHFAAAMSRSEPLIVALKKSFTFADSICEACETDDVNKAKPISENVEKNLIIDTPKFNFSSKVSLMAELLKVNLAGISHLRLHFTGGYS